ncbi:hypothetical protein ILUMI_01279 [Ignelater luminosus]|uniref:cGMP-dependent protein kinase n=1 Tax=Ignelater luminosus TaxID=2038154 RepID=A0A8K0DKF0_IGNLU|nr:hypothetical protein ILUMI_01279 [Ignelater luminosus]
MKFKSIFLCLPRTKKPKPKISLRKEEQEDGMPIGKLYKQVGQDAEEQVLSGKRLRRSGLAGRAINIEKYDPTTVSKIRYPKQESDEELIKTALNNNEFIRNLLEDEQLQAIVDAMYFREVDSGEVIIREGTIGTRLYVSANGTFQVTIDGKLKNSFDDNRVFGEFAVLYDVKCQATIKALSSGGVWILDQDVYQDIKLTSDIQYHNKLLTFLKNIPKLNDASDEILKQVVDLLKHEFFPAEHIIIRQGDIGDKCYIINAGSVTVRKDGDEVRKMVYGEFFGQLALLNDTVRQATVTADSPGVECFSLSQSEFIEYFGNIKDIKDIPEIPVRTPTLPVVKPFENVNFDDLKVVGILGGGGFGQVQLVQHKEHKQLVFALKRIKKIDVVQRQQQEHVYNEKIIQMRCNNPFIVQMYKTYRDSKYIYFLMESCLGGDLSTVLNQQANHRLEESAAKFYAASVLEAFSYLHERNIIYRDLKPENLLLDARGYLKLSDFGSAKQLESQRKTYTFVGTTEYLAPEIILNRRHNRGVDYWTLGILIFELLVGETPFCSSNDMRTCELILRGIKEVNFPKIVDSKAEDLVKKLCKPLAVDRLGYQNIGIEAIRNHRWFANFNWYELRCGQLEPPIKRHIKNNTDMQYSAYFNGRGSVIPPDELSGWDNEF